MEAYGKRTGRDPLGYFAVGDAGLIAQRIGEYVAEGVSKFVLRPAGPPGESLEQLAQVAEAVIPAFHAR